MPPTQTITAATPRFQVRTDGTRYAVGVRQTFTRAVRVPVGETVVRVDQAPVWRVGVRQRSTRVIVGGTQGPRGAPGDGWIEVAFAFGDATPKPLASVAAGTLVKAVRLFVTEGFDGTAPALAVGDAGDPERLMAAGQNLPGVVGEYETAPGVVYDVLTQVRLTITPGAGATTGRGVVVIEA